MEKIKGWKKVGWKKAGRVEWVRGTLHVTITKARDMRRFIVTVYGESKEWGDTVHRINLFREEKEAQDFALEYMKSHKGE